MKVGKVYNGVPKVKNLKSGSIKNLRDVALEKPKEEGKQTIMRYNPFLISKEDHRKLVNFVHQEVLLIGEAVELKGMNFGRLQELKEQIAEVKAERTRYMDYLATKYPL